MECTEDNGKTGFREESWKLIEERKAVKYKTLTVKDKEKHSIDQV